MASQNDVSGTLDGKGILSSPLQPQPSQKAAMFDGARKDTDPRPEDDESDQSFLTVLLRVLSVWTT